jgi:hypothetical protein
MMIDDDTLKQLLRINDELLQLCKFLNEKRDMDTASRLIPLVDELTHILIEAGKNKLHWRAMMESYKGYFVDGSAMPVHPFSPDYYVGGSILVSGRSGSVVEIERFQLQQFTVSLKRLAEWSGLEVARIVVDECLSQRENWMAKYVCRSCPRCNGYLGIVAGDQWTVLEIAVIDLRGCGSRETPYSPIWLAAFDLVPIDGV